MPPLGGFQSEYRTEIGTEKLEWLGYPMVKKIEDIFIRFDATHARDRQTDGQTPRDGMAALMHSIARQWNEEIAAGRLPRSLYIPVT